MVAWHGVLPVEQISDYVVELNSWLKGHGIDTDLKLPWLPHVTLARSPFNISEWERGFVPLPFYFDTLHLYESLPGLHYKPIWSKALIAPIEELEHTADLAFHINGETEDELYNNAFTALSFHFPPLLDYRQPPPQNFAEIVSTLNYALALADAEKGCPFKAVSHHGELHKKPHLHWEMIVDV